MKLRRGISILEVLIATTMVGLLLASTAVLLTVTFRTQTQVRGDLQQQLTLARLNRRFRADAHTAIECDLSESCEFTLPDDSTIRYSWQAPRLEREVHREGKTVHRDSFELPRDARVRFAIEDDTSRRLARLEIDASDAAPARYAIAVRPARIEAVIHLTPATIAPAEQKP